MVRDDKSQHHPARVLQPANLGAAKGADYVVDQTEFRIEEPGPQNSVRHRWHDAGQEVYRAEDGDEAKFGVDQVGQEKGENQAQRHRYHREYTIVTFRALRQNRNQPRLFC